MMMMMTVMTLMMMENLFCLSMYGLPHIVVAHLNESLNCNSDLAKHIPILPPPLTRASQCTCCGRRVSAAWLTVEFCRGFSDSLEYQVISGDLR